MYTVTIELPSDDADDGDAVSAAGAWLAACLAAPCPPLWATLARDALALGWPRDGLREPGYRVRMIVAMAAALANEAGAPASDRLDSDSMTYTTVSETVISLDNGTMTISGGAASVLRRALAAAELAGVRYVADAALVDAALAEVGERAATLTRSRLQTDVVSAAHRGQRYVADVEECW